MSTTTDERTAKLLEALLAVIRQSRASAHENTDRRHVRAAPCPETDDAWNRFALLYSNDLRTLSGRLTCLTEDAYTDRKRHIDESFDVELSDASDAWNKLALLLAQARQEAHQTANKRVEVTTAPKRAS